MTFLLKALREYLCTDADFTETNAETLCVCTCMCIQIHIYIYVKEYTCIFKKINAGLKKVMMLLLVPTQLLNCVRLFVILWTIARQAFLSMGYPKQEYWSWSPFPPPGDLPNPGFEPTSLVSPALAGGFFTSNTTW